MSCNVPKKEGLQSSLRLGCNRKGQLVYSCPFLVSGNVVEWMVCLGCGRQVREAYGKAKRVDFL